MENFAARQVVECLRSGVSSRSLSAIFSYGREAACERVGRELERVRAEGGAISLVAKGNFGNGKTHFLKHRPQSGRDELCRQFRAAFQGNSLR